MKASTLKLDLTKVEAESTSMFSKVPAGDYEVSVAHSQFKDGKKSGSAGLQVGYMIESGPEKGKLIQDYINIANENDKAVEIGHRRLKLIMQLQARKSFVLNTDMDLISRNKFMITVDLESSTYEGKGIERNVVKKLFASETNAPVQESAASKGVSKKEVVKEEVVEEKKEKLPWE